MSEEHQFEHLPRIERLPQIHPRDEAFSMSIGGVDKSSVRETFSTVSNTYFIKDSGVYKLQLADDIDPKRTNPQLPHGQLIVIQAGFDNEVVGKILMTAKYLFGENQYPVNSLLGTILEQSVFLTAQILDVSILIDELSKDIQLVDQSLVQSDGYLLPTTIGLKHRVHTIIALLDKIKDTIYSLFNFKFFSELSRPDLNKLRQAITKALANDVDILQNWEILDRYLHSVRELRNHNEHADHEKWVRVVDFTLTPTGQIRTPYVELKEKNNDAEKMPLDQFLPIIKKNILDGAEMSFLVLRQIILLSDNSFGETVIAFPDDQRKHPLVQYYRAIMLGDQVRIIE